MVESVPRYWAERIYRYRLLARKCKKCGEVLYPPRERCQCGSDEFEDILLPRRGKLLSYTVIHNAPTKYREYEPYAIGLIELSDGTKLVAQLTDVPDFEKLHVGMEVEAVFRKVKEESEQGLIHYGVKFRPALPRSE